MSSKSSPTKKDEKSTSSLTKKDDKATSSPKKDEKASSLILTRNQSTFLNTRQLRNKDSSRKRISEFTQQLMNPVKERNTKTAQSHKKKSPKDKKEKVGPNIIKKKETVEVKKLILEMQKEIKPAGKKRRKIITVPKVPEVKPAKRARASPLPRALTAQELIELCEEQSLDDDDFLEILTCESPVWWEEPIDIYEDDVFSKAHEIRNFQVYKKSIKVEPITPDTTEINIPTVKQNDDKFMKKRSKLENLLGNIKNKLTDTPPEVKNDIANVVDEIMETVKYEPSENAKEKLIKQEPEYHRKKSPSESTTSSEDMFFGFQNDEVLKDFENMDIPIENIEKEQENEQKENVETKTTTADNKPINNIDTKDERNEDKTTTSSFLEGSMNSSDDVRENESLCEDAACDDQKCSACNKSKSAGVSDTKICQNNCKSVVNKDGIKIYYIDATASKSNKKNPDKNNTKESNVNNKREKSRSLLIKETNVATENQSIVSKNDITYTEASVKTDASISNNGELDKNNITKQDQEAEPNKPKILYKDQLMAVYKIITDDNYRVSLQKTDTNEVETVKSNFKEIDTLALDNYYTNIKRKPDKKKRNSKKFILDLVNKDNTEPKNEMTKENDTITYVTKTLNGEDNVSIDKETRNDERDKEKYIKNDIEIDSKTNQTQSNEQSNKSTNCKEPQNDTILENRENTSTDGSRNIKLDMKSVKYCLKCSSIFETDTCIYCARKRIKYCMKCSSIFETDTCSYCAKKSQDNNNNSGQQPRKGSV